MKASDFIAAFGKSSLSAWEAAAYELVKSGENVAPTMVPVTLTHKDGRKAILSVSADYFSVGTAEDSLRLPLTPLTAQKIANLSGMLLPTPKLVYTLWRMSVSKVQNLSIAALGQSNKGPNFGQYVAHDAAVNAQFARLGVNPKLLVSGHKKDVVIGNLHKPGKVLIFGWYKPEPDVFDDRSGMDSPKRQPTQPYSNVHGDFYVDYSHGIRLVSPLMTVEGKDVETEKVYSDAALSDFVSHEGPVRRPRYPASFPTGPQGRPLPQGAVASLLTPTTPSYVDLGTEVLVRLSQN